MLLMISLKACIGIASISSRVITFFFSKLSTLVAYVMESILTIVKGLVERTTNQRKQTTMAIRFH